MGDPAPGCGGWVGTGLKVNPHRPAFGIDRGEKCRVDRSHSPLAPTGPRSEREGTRSHIAIQQPDQLSIYHSSDRRAPIREGSEAIQPLLIRIHDLENQSDQAFRAALAKLFNAPNPDPLMVMKWKEVYDRVEIAVDKCEDVASVVESVVVKYA